VAPELLYLETRWASLMSYGMTAELLKDVLPIGGTADASTIRRHLHKVAARHEADLSGEQPGGIDAGKGQPLPQETVIVSIDGGYVRNWHDKQHTGTLVLRQNPDANLPRQPSSCKGEAHSRMISIRRSDTIGQTTRCQIKS
jgi:hypothetical protein